MHQTPSPECDFGHRRRWARQPQPARSPAIVSRAPRIRRAASPKASPEGLLPPIQISALVPWAPVALPMLPQSHASAALASIACLVYHGQLHSLPHRSWPARLGSRQVPLLRNLPRMQWSPSICGKPMKSHHGKQRRHTLTAAPARPCGSQHLGRAVEAEMKALSRQVECHATEALSPTSLASGAQTSFLLLSPSRGHLSASTTARADVECAPTPR
mmetsp:Transcript_32767/g.94310  ORF Transcript_32767/g.94310 Transcript_32767/m.94310 type:complete len:216 (-) Transcript_32767:502-1149(-)